LSNWAATGGRFSAMPSAFDLIRSTTCWRSAATSISGAVSRPESWLTMVSVVSAVWAQAGDIDADSIKAAPIQTSTRRKPRFICGTPLR